MPKYIDADKLLEEVKSIIERQPSVDPAIVLESMSIYGYPIDDLMIFADACRKKGIQDYEMHDFVLNVQEAFNYVLTEQQKNIEEAFKRMIDGMEGPG